MTTITNNYKLFAIIGALVFIFSFSALVITSESVQGFLGFSSAEAAGSCGSCGDTGGGGGGGGDDEDFCDKNPEAPQCNNTPPDPTSCDFLNANPEVIRVGDQVQLSWGTTNATKLILVRPGGDKLDVTGRTSTFVTPPHTHTFVLEVYGRGALFDLKNTVLIDTCEVTVTVDAPAPEPKCLAFDADPTTLPASGGTTKLTWSTENATKVELRNVTTGAKVQVAKNNSSGRPENIVRDTIFQLLVTGADGSVDNSCRVSIDLDTPTPDAKCLDFKANPTNLGVGGGTTKLTWSTENATKVELRNVTTGAKVQVAKNNSTGRPESIVRDTVFRLIVTGTNGQIDNSCVVRIDVADPTPDPLCIFFTATPKVFNNGIGGDVTLDWDTENLVSASINQGIGPVGLKGPKVVTFSVVDSTVSVSKTFTLTGVAADGRRVTCEDTVTINPVTDKPPVTCEANANFTANPTSLPAGGGNVTLTWATTKVASAKLNGVVVALSDTKVENVTSNKTFILEITGDSTTAGNTVQCPIPVTVAPPTGDISCEQNVNFRVSDSSVRRGDKVTLTWSVTGNVDTVSIDNGIGVVGKTGSREVEVDDDTDFYLTISNANDSDQCPVSVNVSSGGGGGGTPRPKCEFLASDKSISAGEEITLSWETSRGKDIAIYEGGTKKSDIIFESDDDDVVDEGELTVRPKKDTTYTLIVERGSRDRECEVDIKVKDEVVIKSVRNQGQVAGISLTSVPYTGFEAGPALTMIFYSVLAIWALFVAYMLVIREDTVLGVSLAGAYPKRKVIHEDLSADEVADDSETSEAAAYVGSVIAPTAPLGAVSTPLKSQSATGSSIPSNLPTGEMPQVGYAPSATKTAVEETDEDEQSIEMKELEDRAHENKVLLSSDAMRHLIATCPREVNRVVYLDQIIAEAKISYPSEDGWIVLNLDRMQELCAKRGVAPTTSKVAVADEKKVDVAEVTATGGASSLAEAIVTGNITAAYQMISSRPMFALADAAADLDALFRARKGETVAVSDLLQSEATKLTDEQIKAAIDALTSAIDGTYEDEASAVKMAIMKATKAVS